MIIIACPLGRSENVKLLFLFDNFALDTDRRELRHGAVAVPVEPKVFDLLAYLIKNRERVASKDDLIAAIWGGRIVSESALTSRINAARCAIGDNGAEQRLIKTLTRKGLRFVGAVREEPATETMNAVVPREAATQRPKELSLPDKPSIAVLPFTNLSGDPVQDYFSDGITEDITTELSRFSDLMVIARNSAFQYKGKAVDIRQVARELGARYVLEGGVRRSGDRIRITAQLIDAVTGAHRWAERYDRELHDVFAVQDEVVRAIVAILAAHVTRAEIERALLKPPAAWEAYECYLRGAEGYFLHSNSRTKASLFDTRRLLEQCLAIDPGYARAAAILSFTYLRAYVEPYDGDYLSPAALNRALELAKAAVDLDPRLPQARAQLGQGLIYKRQHATAIAEFERALALNPNYIDHRYAQALMYAGESARAIEVVETNLRLDPFPWPHAFGYMGVSNYMLKRHGEAVHLCRECALRLPNLQLPHLWLAAAFAQSGHLEEARKETAEVLRINPGFTIASWRNLAVYKNSEDAEHLLDGLRKAGLPEV
jgi:adenylate cyclase